MNPKERNAMEKAINTRLYRLDVILTENSDKAELKTGAFEDESARLDELSQLPVDETLINIAREEKARLLSNLEWLKSGNAGLCQQCGEKIPIQRLLTVPTTRHCIGCAKSGQM